MQGVDRSCIATGKRVGVEGAALYLFEKQESVLLSQLVFL